MIESSDLMSTPLLTHEVGSLDKPGWRVKGYAGKALEDRDLEEARSWGERVGVEDYEQLIALLRRSPLQAKEDKESVKRWSSRYGLRLQESAGLDAAYDGEQQRSEMYAWAVAHTNGFEWRGKGRAVAHKKKPKGGGGGPPPLAQPHPPPPNPV